MRIASLTFLKKNYWEFIQWKCKLDVKLLLFFYYINNNFSKNKVCSIDCDVIVSITTFGKRLNTVYLTLESIASGTKLPKRMILWLDEPVVLPKSLLRLQCRGLEINYCENFGPHTKYYPYIESDDNFTVPLVTADDDVMYPKLWLQGLVDAYIKNPNFINCYRARDIRLTDSAFAPYITWPLRSSTKATFAAMVTGVSGVIYPVSFQQHLKRSGRQFMELCPKADDIWLHVTALREGVMVRQIQENAMAFQYLPDTQDIALWPANGPGGGNDRQILATYSAEDINKLRRSIG